MIFPHFSHLNWDPNWTNLERMEERKNHGNINKKSKDEIRNQKCILEIYRNRSCGQKMSENSSSVSPLALTHSHHSPLDHAFSCPGSWQAQQKVRHGKFGQNCHLWKNNMLDSKTWRKKRKKNKARRCSPKWLASSPSGMSCSHSMRLICPKSPAGQNNRWLELPLAIHQAPSWLAWLPGAGFPKNMFNCHFRDLFTAPHS